jgi:hypothetical protein
VISRSKEFDLGRDRKRITNLSDAERQQETVDAILNRFYHPRPAARFDVQILADEVGMGKTFVALGVAYSVLAHLKAQRSEPDLDGCYQRVLILTPSNQALYTKWRQETLEFVSRCVPPEVQSDISFSAVGIERLDDLAAELRKPGRQKQIIVARMGMLGARLLESDLKRRFTLGVLFRYWGVAFNHAQRESLLKGAPDGWPRYPDELTEITEQDNERLPFDQEQLLNTFKSLRGEDAAQVDELLQLCRELAEPFYRNRSADFAKVNTQLTNTYRLAVQHSIQRDFPLLIVDEAHNWKNGPSEGTNGYRLFRDILAPHVRRVLLLSATPFQLRPEEILELLKVGDSISPAPTRSASEVRCDRLRVFRDTVLRPILKGAEEQSKLFSHAWMKLPRRVGTEALAAAWASPQVANARQQMQQLRSSGITIAQHKSTLEDTVRKAISTFDPDLRQFLREALILDCFNADLSNELGKVVVRHRRQTDHRRFRVGEEYLGGNEISRPDAHLLHANPGIDIRGDAELPQFVLMRCVSLMKRGKGRTSLGSDLTGCYSTLHDSAEGRRLAKALKEDATGQRYLKLLNALASRSQDPKHPKMSAVVENVVPLWRGGEKVLIFCTRVNTAERLRDIIDKRVRKELANQKQRVLGGEAQLKSLRSRLTGRDRDLIGISLDRVLWSLAWASRTGDFPFDPSTFTLTDEELNDLAFLALKYDVNVVGERVDRVFLTRATEHIIAQRLLRSSQRAHHCSSIFAILSHICSEEWITAPYGSVISEDHQIDAEDSAAVDERGVNRRYTARQIEYNDPRVGELALTVRSTRQRAKAQNQIPVIDAYASSPSLWFGDKPLEFWKTPTASETILSRIHDLLWKLTKTAASNVQTSARDTGYDWHSRALSLQALRRAVLRDSVLLRLMPERGDLDESTWGQLLTKAFFKNLPNQHEAMAHRVASFLEDLESASGSLLDSSTARGALFAATRLRDQQFVALVKGGSTRSRERIFTGFNTPLLPEILICTQVGQEGIDLHRQCRHVVHYDLAWNPAVLEQRTGRADRLGSKTFRERELAAQSDSVFLEVGVPYLAGTYDERMFEELRLRAQTFEVLTGGDFSAEYAEEEERPEVSDTSLSAVDLPPQMVSDLRVRLAVWEPQAQSNAQHLQGRVASECQENAYIAGKERCLYPPFGSALGNIMPTIVATDLSD